MKEMSVILEDRRKDSHALSNYFLGLRQAANSTMAKGKQVDIKSAERLKRNEDKLIKIRESTSKFTQDLCILMEEVTERSWRDLHPLLVKIAQFDVTLSKDEASAIASLNNVVSELKNVASKHGIKPQARLKDLESLDPVRLSTRTDGGGPLALENGFAGMALGGSASSPFSNNDDMHFPPGSTAPQGLGGFPVQVKTSDYGRSNSFDGSTGHSSAATGGALSTLDMMAINASAAPAPTMDALSQAFGPRASMTGPSSGGSINLGRNRNQSLDSLDSFVSGHSHVSQASAPPPAAPPPPPPPGADSGSNYNPFGGSAPAPFAPPNPFGGTPSFSAPAAAPMSMYGSTGSSSAPPSYGGYAPTGSFAQQPPTYGQPPPPSYGQPPPQQQYGQPPPQQYSQQQYGQIPPGNVNPFG
jgi:hypothetical protein